MSKEKNFDKSFGSGEIGKIFKKLPLNSVVKNIPFSAGDLIEAGIALDDFLRAVEAKIILETLIMANGNYTHAAKWHKMTRTTFQARADRLNRYGSELGGNHIRYAIAADFKLKKSDMKKQASIKLGLEDEENGEIG